VWRDQISAFKQSRSGFCGRPCLRASGKMGAIDTHSDSLRGCQLGLVMGAPHAVRSRRFRLLSQKACEQAKISSGKFS
jgi:hypothetical protein